MVERDLVKRGIRFDGGGYWGKYPFWQSPESIVRAFREAYPALPVRNVTVEDECGKAIWREAPASPTPERGDG